MQEKSLRIINFKPQTSLSDCIFKENKILRIWDFVNYKYALFVRKPLRTENVVILNDMFVPLNLNHNHITRAAISHLLDVSQKQTCHYGTYSIVFTASKVWNDVLRKSNKDLLFCEFSAFKKTMLHISTLFFMLYLFICFYTSFSSTYILYLLFCCWYLIARFVKEHIFYKFHVHNFIIIFIVIIVIIIIFIIFSLFIIFITYCFCFLVYSFCK